MIGTGVRGAGSLPPQFVELYFGDSGPVQIRGPRIDCSGLGLNVGACTVSDEFATAILQESGDGRAWQPLGARRTCKFIRAVVQSPDPVPNLQVTLTLS